MPKTLRAPRLKAKSPADFRLLDAETRFRPMRFPKHDLVHTADRESTALFVASDFAKAGAKNIIIHPFGGQNTPNEWRVYVPSSTMRRLTARFNANPKKDIRR